MLDVILRFHVWSRNLTLTQQFPLRHPRVHAPQLNAGNAMRKTPLKLNTLKKTWWTIIKRRKKSCYNKASLNCLSFALLVFINALLQAFSFEVLAARSILLPDTGNTKGGSITVLLTSCLTGLELAVWQLKFFCFYLQNRLIQTSQTGGQQYSDTSPFSIPCLILRLVENKWFGTLT